MVCDNFDEIRNLLTFKNENDFYLIELIKRKKDSEPNEKYLYYEEKTLLHYDIPIKNWCIFNKNDIYKYKDEIILLSNLYNARAYIFLQRKNWKTIFNFSVKKIGDILINNDYKSTEDIIFCSCVDCMLDNKNSWLIDLDIELFQYENDVINFIKQYNQDYIILNSLTGKHIICDNLDECEFILKFPMIKIHYNRPTLLYYKK